MQRQRQTQDKTIFEMISNILIEKDIKYINFLSLLFTFEIGGPGGPVGLVNCPTR